MKSVRLLIALFACLGLMGNSTMSYAQRGEFGAFGTSPTGNFLAGRQALNQLDTGSAASFLVYATNDEWDNYTIVERAFGALAANGQIDDADTLARHLLELEPDYSLAHLLVGTVALKERRYASADKELSAVGLQDFIGITAAVLRAWTDIGRGDFNKAMSQLDDLSSVGLDDFLVFHRAMMADAVNNLSAIDYMARAYKTDPLVPNIVSAYVHMLGNAGRFDEAKAVLDAYTAQGLAQKAVTSLYEPIEQHQLPGKYAADIAAGASEVYRGIGAALARDGAPDVAMVFLRLALYLNPDADVVRLTIAQLYEQLDQYDEANAIYDAISPRSIYKPEAVVQLAANLDKEGDRSEAIRRLKNMVQIEPDNIEAISSLADLLRFDKQFAEAQPYYSKLIELSGGNHPGDWLYYYLRGICYERTKDWPLAEADFLKALDLRPDQAQVLNYLGYSWVDRGENLDRALGMIEKAVRQSPSDGYIVDSLGWAFFKLGRIDEAVSVLEQAVHLEPNDPEINDHLGDAYWKAGREREARFQWRIAIDVDETGDVTERATPKLEHGLTGEEGDSPS
ncbi:MAG: tetratricopeptide repeat protein [Hyphomicrobiaceae bacterium]|nr:tetratricopeptide repeat protein [Hyphomicrobiaceae bacterium]